MRIRRFELSWKGNPSFNRVEQIPRTMRITSGRAVLNNGDSLRLPGAATNGAITSDFDTCFQNLLSNQTLLGRQKVLGTTNVRFR
jgi:hypothetical protein